MLATSNFRRDIETKCGRERANARTFIHLVALTLPYKMYQNGLCGVYCYAIE